MVGAGRHGAGGLRWSMLLLWGEGEEVVVRSGSLVHLPAPLED